MSSSLLRHLFFLSIKVIRCLFVCLHLIYTNHGTESKRYKKARGKVSHPPYFSATQLFSLYHTTPFTLLFACNNTSRVPFPIGVCETVFSSMNTPLFILTSLLSMGTVTDFLPLEAVLRWLSLYVQHLCSGARRAIWCIVHFPVQWSSFHHVFLHMYGKRKSSIISASFPSYYKTLHGHICVSPSHRSPETAKRNLKCFVPSPSPRSLNKPAWFWSQSN